MHRLAHGGRCVGILVIRRLFRFDFDRHANPHRPPPCIPQVALPCEVAAMNTPYPTYPRLQALLGAALPDLQLSTTAAEALEDALTEADEQAPQSAFFARLRGIAHSHGADGQAWRERQLSEARGNWPRRRAVLPHCPPAAVCCWRRSRRARWMMRRCSVRHRWRKGCCMRWWCWPIMPGRWWSRMRARRCRRAEPMLGCTVLVASVGSVPTKVGTYQSRVPRAQGRYQSARSPMLPSMMRRFSLRSPPSSRV